MLFPVAHYRSAKLIRQPNLRYSSMFYYIDIVRLYFSPLFCILVVSEETNLFIHFFLLFSILWSVLYENFSYFCIKLRKNNFYCIEISVNLIFFVIFLYISGRIFYKQLIDTVFHSPFIARKNLYIFWQLRVFLSIFFDKKISR